MTGGMPLAWKNIPLPEIADLTATMGGALTPEIEFIDPPYRPGDEPGMAWIKAHDAHDFFLVYAGHPVDGNWQNQIANYEVRDTTTEKC